MADDIRRQIAQTQRKIEAANDAINEMEVSMMDEEDRDGHRRDFQQDVRAYHKDLDDLVRKLHDVQKAEAAAADPPAPV